MIYCFQLDRSIQGTSCSLRFCHDEVESAKKAAGQRVTPATTIFSKIIDGSIPANIIHRDEKCLAFHDVSPQAPVHFLVIPIKPIPMLEKIEAEDKEVYWCFTSTYYFFLNSQSNFSSASRSLDVGCQ